MPAPRGWCEALLRVPDADTADRLIEDKLKAGDWAHHDSRSAALLVSASDTTTFSSVRKHRHHHGNAAAFGAVADMFGIIAGLAAADRYRDDYYDYGYDDGPYYAPYGYNGGSYDYAPGYRFRGSPGHSGHHHHHR